MQKYPGIMNDNCAISFAYFAARIVDKQPRINVPQSSGLEIPKQFIGCNERRNPRRRVLAKETPSELVQTDGHSVQTPWTNASSASASTQQDSAPVTDRVTNRTQTLPISALIQIPNLQPHRSDGFRQRLPAGSDGAPQDEQAM